MKAIVYQDFGSPDSLRCEEIDKPIPGDNEVLIKIRAASVNPLDWKLMKGGPFIVRLLLGLGKPKIKRPGVDMAGQVEAVGRNVTHITASASPQKSLSSNARGRRASLVRHF
jgi:NADPH:quinone reductase-like Zn-dependent oxidoreductase